MDHYVKLNDYNDQNSVANMKNVLKINRVPKVIFCQKGLDLFWPLLKNFFLQKYQFTLLNEQS